MLGVTQFLEMITRSGATLFSTGIPCVYRHLVFDKDFWFSYDGVFVDNFLVISDEVFGDDFKVKSNFFFL